MSRSGEKLHADWEGRLARRTGAPVVRLPIRRLALAAAGLLLLAVLFGLG